MRIRSVEDLGARVRDRRRALKLSQAAVAARAGVTRQWLVRFEQGASDMSLSKAFAVLDALGLNVRVTEPSERAVAVDVNSPFTIRLPNIDVPDIRLPDVDWTDVSRRLAIRSTDMSAALSAIRQRYSQMSDSSNPEKTDRG